MWDFRIHRAEEADGRRRGETLGIFFSLNRYISVNTDVYRV